MAKSCSDSGVNKDIPAKVYTISREREKGHHFLGIYKRGNPESIAVVMERDLAIGERISALLNFYEHLRRHNPAEADALDRGEMLRLPDPNPLTIEDLFKPRG